MPIWRNFFLGSELTSGFGPFKSMDVEKMKAITLKELAEMGIDLRDVEQPIGQLSGGERQCVAIARAVYFGAKVLILDEPTAALGVKQSGVVLRYILQARDRGLGVIFITHNPHHAFPVGDRFLLLKRGKSIGYYDKKDITLDELTAQMAGGAELAELAHELEQLGGHSEAVKEVKAEVAEVADALTPAARNTPNGSSPAGCSGHSSGAPRHACAHQPCSTRYVQERNTMPIRVGVIGAGIMGADHIRNLSTTIGGAEVTFVADLDADRAAAAAPPSARITTDPSELINSSEVDAVVVASHDSTHAGLVLECFEAMTPVLCEKPLAPTVLESLEVVAADADMVAATGASLLSLGLYAALRPRLRGTAAGRAGPGAGRALDGPLHQPERCGCSRRHRPNRPSPIRPSTSWTSFPGCWTRPSRKCHGRPARAPGGGAGLQDPAFMTLRTADGTLTTLELFLNARYGYTTRCEVVSERGTTALAGFGPAVALEQEGTKQAQIPADWRPRFADAYRLQLQAWISALAAGEKPPSPARRTDSMPRSLPKP